MPGDQPGADERWCFRCEAIIPREATTCPECGAALRPYGTWVTDEVSKPSADAGAGGAEEAVTTTWVGVPSRKLVGAGVGAVAFLLVYAAIWVVSSLTLSSLPVSFGGIGDPVPAWKAIGWVFYRAHHATIAGLGFSVTGVVFDGTGARSYAGTLIDSPSVFLVPPVGLTLAGYVSARLGSPVDSFPRRGASIVRGYLPLSVAGLLLTISTEHLCLFVYPEPVSSVGLVGLAYPLAFGALGGLLAARTRSPDQGASSR